MSASRAPTRATGRPDVLDRVEPSEPRPIEPSLYSRRFLARAAISRSALISARRFLVAAVAMTLTSSHAVFDLGVRLPIRIAALRLRQCLFDTRILFSCREAPFPAPASELFGARFLTIVLRRAASPVFTIGSRAMAVSSRRARGYWSARSLALPRRATAPGLRSVELPDCPYNTSSHSGRTSSGGHAMPAAGTPRRSSPQCRGLDRGDRTL